MPKCQLAMQSDLIISHLQCEAMVERQREAFDVDDDAPHLLPAGPMSSPQSCANQYMSAELKSIYD